MQIFSNLRADLKTYGGDWTYQGFWVMVVYRLGRWRYTIQNSWLRKPFSFLYKFLYKIIQILTGIEFPCEAEVGDNFRIDHFGDIIVSGYARFGDNCILRNGVTVGLRHTAHPVAPVIGNNVDVGVGAKILGDITIGDNVVIGANAVVLKDIPANHIAVGVPARALPRKEEPIPPPGPEGTPVSQSPVETRSTASPEKQPAPPPMDPLFEHGPVDIDCVLIGVNAASTLPGCIQSVLNSRYGRGAVHVIYVDGGSSDNSAALARSFEGVQVIEIRPEYPSPGLGRNAGWQAGRSPLVQFLDSDTILDPDWLETAVAAMGERVGAVRGNRRERHPKASVYNWIGDLEWNAPPGECDAFGGDVLIRRSILEETGGYDEVLVGGEDPELSQRVRLKGWKILQLDAPMTTHDLAMTRIRQYWRRGYRTGYGFAAVTARFRTRAKGFWIHELIRILIRGGGGLSLILLGILGAIWEGEWLLLALPGLALILFPRLFRVPYFAADKGLSQKQAKIYAWHCSLVVIPEFFGVLRFVRGRITGTPLRNKRSTLNTSSTESAAPL